jgi:8-oxo-dGTP pyrophosphatase MutT (NUDIX family)
MTTRTLDAEIAFPAQCELAEGPVWDAVRGLLRWVDILRGDVHALDPVSGEHSSFGTGQPVGTVGLTRDGGLVLALAGGFALSGADGQNLRPFGDFSVDRSVTRFNDGKPDPWGSFWAGTMAVPEDSGFPCSLYRLSPDGAVTELFGGVGLSNGLDWTGDRRVFNYSDSHAGVDVLDTDPDTGALGARHTCSMPELTTLLDRYRPEGDAEEADFQRVRALLDVSADPSRRDLPLHVTASALIVHPPTARVLLRWHQRQHAWLQVGGHGDPGETDPLAIVAREAEEETGLTDLVPWPDGEIKQVVIVDVPPGKGEPAHQHADVRFFMATGTPDAIRAENAQAQLRWLTLPAARDTTSEPNLREALTRIEPLLKPRAT